MKSESEDNQGLVVQVADSFQKINIDADEVRRLVRAICSRFGLLEGFVSVAILDDEEILQLNQEFLKHDSVTDVISFDLSEQGDEEPIFELVVNGQMAVRQGSERGHSAQAELALYITHGLLHNLGFDDKEETKAKEMHKAEDEILKSLGYGEVFSS